MEHRTLDDESLMQWIAKRRPEALGELYDRYGRLAFSVAMATVDDASTAEEITQDVFVRVWERAEQYRADRGKVSTWLTSIARHRAIDQLRRQGARPEAQSLAWAEVTPQDKPATVGVEESVELELERQRVRAAVGQLPEEQRQVLALAYFRGYTQGEIAAALGLPLGTVKTRIRLAMEKLRAALQNER